ncbi:hypothetical protein HPP92_017242 [Vanilla planifolia]|uniref:Ethylene insensitive 3-like DNA-binding domain-containing protein n=1 Tax=Vanilla planifolia TaxID=51239 RepID=A0A835Q8Y6_VANPL|nr:hypothetical protein HPP92_017242 [Vanilla planifolia]
MDKFAAVDALDFEVDEVHCESLTENDVSDEEIEEEELARRMWRDKVKLKGSGAPKDCRTGSFKSRKPSSPLTRLLEKMSRAQDGILKYMLKLVEVCNARDSSME